MTGRVLFLAAHRPGRAPNQRFRFEQYTDFLHDNGLECELSYLLDERADRVLYRPGRAADKGWILARALARRLRDVARSRRFDLVVVVRESFFAGGAFIEAMLARSGAALAFDFDDALWCLDVSPANRRWDWLKAPSKTGRIIALADLVLAGNEHLAGYARRHTAADRVVVMPTTIDTELYRPRPRRQPGGPVRIGWSGSTSTIKHFALALPVLTELRARFGDRVEFTVIGDGDYRHEPLDIAGKPWSRASELDDLAGFDIGIMPLPDEDWARGKCGLKGLQCMALAVPVVMSPVGVNRAIIDDGGNGMLASSDAEWVDKLGRLVESAELRAELGDAGRQTVVERYSVAAHRDRYLATLAGVIARRREGRR